jgi:hypothetical protein
LQTENSFQDDYTDESIDTSEDKSQDDSQTSPGGGTSNPDSELWSDDYSDNYSDNAKDTTQAGSISQINVTDPSTGVATSIITGDKTKDISGDQYGDQLTDDEGGNTTTGGAPSDNFSDNQRDNSNDLYTDHGTEDTSVTGSPQAGTTINANSHLILDETDKDGEQSQDNFTAPDTDAGDVQFQTSTDDYLGGKASTTVVNTVNTNDGQGNTANATVTLTDKSTVGGKDHGDDNGGDDFSDVNGTPATDDENDTDHSNDFAQVSEDVGDQYSGTYGSFDPVTGLSANTTVNGNDDAHETDTEIDQGQDIHSESGTSTPVIADNVSFDDKVDEEGGSTDYEQVIATTQGTDLQGEQVNLQATITNNANGTNSLTDEDDGGDNVSSVNGDTGGDTEIVHADVLSGATIIQTLTGTIASTDPATGIKTTTSEDDTDSNTSSLQDHEDETDIRTRTPAGETDNDTADQTDTNTQTENWTDSETVTPTNPDGSSAGTPTTTTNTGGNILGSTIGLQYAPDGSQTPTATGTESGSNTSSDPAVGTTAWTNQPVDSTRLNEFTSNVSRLTNLAPQSTNRGSGSSSATTPQAPMTSGINAARAAGNEQVQNSGAGQESWMTAGPTTSSRVLRLINDAKQAAADGERQYSQQLMQAAQLEYAEEKGTAYLDYQMRQHASAVKEVASTTNIITVTGAAVDGAQQYVITPINEYVVAPAIVYTNDYVIDPANQYIFTPINNNVIAPALEAREFMIDMTIDSSYGHGASETIKDPVVRQTATMQTDFMLSMPLDLIGGRATQVAALRPTAGFVGPRVVTTTGGLGGTMTKLLPGAKVGPDDLMAARRVGTSGVWRLEGKINKANLADTLANTPNTTEMAKKIAAGIRSEEIGVNIVSDPLFDAAWKKWGDGSPPIDIRGFAKGDQIYLRRRSPTIVSDSVHEGTHVIDNLDGYRPTTRAERIVLEKRAYMYERQFQKETGRRPTFPNVPALRQHIYDTTP